MPELLRVLFLLPIFAKRIHHARIIQTIRFHLHVHVRGHNGDAKFNWDGEGFVMEYAHNIKANDLNRWYELFKTDNEDNQ